MWAAIEWKQTVCSASVYVEIKATCTLFYCRNAKPKNSSTRMLSLRLLRWPTLAQPARMSLLTARGGIDRGYQTAARVLLRLTSSYATASKTAAGGAVFKLTKVDGSVNEEHAAKETTATELAPEPGVRTHI